jgi:DNA-binding response OmpR family regulator
VKALIVDSDINAIHAIGKVLRQRGYGILEATTFDEAKRLWTAEHPPILIADVRLGQFNGLQLLLRARADRPDVIAIITSTVADKVLEADTLRFGGTFLVKPIAAEQVIELVQSMRASHSVEGAKSLVERRVGQRRHPTSRPWPHEERRRGDRRKTPRP